MHIQSLTTPHVPDLTFALCTVSLRGLSGGQDDGGTAPSAPPFAAAVVPSPTPAAVVGCGSHRDPPMPPWAATASERDAVPLSAVAGSTSPRTAAHSAPEMQPPSRDEPNRPAAASGVGATAVRSKVRRTVRVADFDRLSKQVGQVLSEAAKTVAQVEAIEVELQKSRRIRLGLDVLQAVARDEQYPCGRALQRVLGQRLLERLKATPARPAARGHAVHGRACHEQVAISFDVPFTRTGLDELVSMQGLTYTPREGRRQARPVRSVHFAGAGALLRALDLVASIEPQQLMCRRFTRADQSKAARPLIERFADEDGSLYYVVSRDAAAGQVVVAVRQSETYDVRRQAFKHPLVQKCVALSSLPGLDEVCPCFLSWRESLSSSAMEWEGADACGSVSLSLPCCTFEHLPADVADLVSSMV